MKCEECKDRISEYLDKEIPEQTFMEMEKHFKDCADCRNELRIMNYIVSETGKIPRHSPSEEVILKISMSIYKSSQKTRRTEFGPVLNIVELAEFLRIDVDTIEEHLDEIPCFEIGGKLLFRMKSVEEWIECKEASFGSQIGRLAHSNIFTHRNIKQRGAEWKIQRNN